MVLEGERPFRRMGRERTAAAVSRLTFHFPVVLHKHAIEKDSDGAGMGELRALPDGLVEHNVIDLPLSRLALRVDERRILGVHRSRLAVGVVLDEPGLSIELLASKVALENLDFIAVLRAHEEDT